MAKSAEQTLIDDGGIRLRCSEAAVIKCDYCGDTSHTVEDWAASGNKCPACDNGSPQHFCARCEGVLEAPPLGEHPCHSADLYRKTKRVAF